MFLQGLNGQCFDVSGIGQVPEPIVCGGPGQRPCPAPPVTPPSPDRRRGNVSRGSQRRFRGLARQMSRLLPQVEAAFQREMRRIVSRQIRLPKSQRRLTCKEAHRQALMTALNQVGGAMRVFRGFMRYENTRNVPFRSYLIRFSTRFPALYFSVN